jgi:hypothetical protein
MQYFLKNSTLKAFEEATITNAFNSLINNLKTLYPHYELIYVESTQPSTEIYNVGLYGVVIYTIIHTQYFIRIECNREGMDGIEFSDFYDLNEFGFIKYVVNKNKFRSVIDSKINAVHNNMMHRYIKKIASKYTEPRSNLYVNYNGDNTIIEFKIMIDSSLVDSRFSVVYNKECDIYEHDVIESNSSPDTIREVIESVISRAKNKIAVLYGNYEIIKKTIGGVTIDAFNNQITVSTEPNNTTLNGEEIVDFSDIIDFVNY